MKLEGLSFLYCVGDIVLGLVNYREVTKIVARTSARHDADWEGILEEYSQSWYWSGNPGAALELAWALIHDGKVDQPTLMGKELQRDLGYHWINAITREPVFGRDLRSRSTD